MCLFVWDNGVCFTLQFGFNPSVSDVNQFADISNSICKAVDKEIHYSESFISSLARRSALFIALSLLLKWVTDYLNKKKQRVALSDAFTQWSPLILALTPLHKLYLSNFNSSMRLFTLHYSRTSSTNTSYF